MTSLLSQTTRINAKIDAVGSVRAIAVLRIFLGPISVLHLRPFLEQLNDGIIYSDRFYEPYASWYPEASRGLYEALLLGAVIAAFVFSIGFMSKLSGAYLAGFIAYNLFLSTTFYQHNRAFLLILVIGVTLLHPGENLSIDSLIRRFRGGPRPARDVPLWPLWLLRLEVALVYLASGISKLIDNDWWSGRVLQLRAVDNRQLALDNGAPAWILDILADGTFQWWLSKGAVLGELVIGLGLLNRRTRLTAIWVAIPFHLMIQISARVQVFSWAALAALIIWVTPVTRQQALTVPTRLRGFAGLVRTFDWFGRFQVKLDDSQSLVLVDDSGNEHRGPDALWRTLNRLPATFWIAGPITVARRQVMPDTG